MAVSVQMPALGESVTEGTVTRWLKQEGDTVEVDEPLLEVSTDKVDTEIPARHRGAEQDHRPRGRHRRRRRRSSRHLRRRRGARTAGRPGRAAGTRTPTRRRGVGPPRRRHPPPAGRRFGSATAVLMPELGESVTEGTVTRWLKKVGDSVAVDEPLVEVSTDKVDTEIPSPAAGTLLSITAEEDATVPRRGELARIGAAGAAAQPPRRHRPRRRHRHRRRRPGPRPRAAAPHRLSPHPANPGPKPEPAATPAAGGDGAPYVTPLVRKLAAENGVDLASVKGTGVGGRIRKQDVLAAAESKKAPAAPAPRPPWPPRPRPRLPRRPPRRPRPAGPPARHHREGQSDPADHRPQDPRVTAGDRTAHPDPRGRHDQDRGAAGQGQKDFAEREGVNLTFLPFIARAVIDALKAHPNINASYNEDTGEITYYDAEHLGFAVDTEQGLLSPVVHNAGDLSLAGLARAINDIAARARSGNLKPDELSGAPSPSPISAARAHCSTPRSWSRRRPPCSAPARSSSDRG